MNSRLWLIIFGLMIVTGFGFNINQTQAQTGGCSTTHIVQRGETLFRIARRYNTTLADLQARNGINNPNRIQAGQQLCINGGFVPPVTPVPGNNNPPAGTGTVTAWFLNVRSGPGTNYGIMRIVTRGTTYPVVGRNANTTWYQITVDAVANIKGWVSGSYVNVSNPQNLPVVGVVVTEPYSMNATLIRDASLHVAPDGNQGIVPQTVFAGMTVRVIGRNQAATWFQITSDNGAMWVRRDVFPAEFPATLFPITG